MMLHDGHVRAWHENNRRLSEVRHVKRLSRDEQIEYCKGVELKRGRPAAVELWEAVKK